MPSKYDYIPDTQLKIQMVEPFLLSIQNLFPQYNP
ncbi:hypothetical protein PAJL_1127 [Cutibacterium acnes HL042PA3]|nr:hypothetical protein PAJL_1127 [Cutibacterium acnes HL042PA3]MCU7483634.1 hypothetical protein [Cutibacterium acnes 19B2]MCU7486678.1 hypothetical protein [Cutibacterium acnes 19B1]